MSSEGSNTRGNCLIIIITIIIIIVIITIIIIIINSYLTIFYERESYRCHKNEKFIFKLVKKRALEKEIF